MKITNTTRTLCAAFFLASTFIVNANNSTPLGHISDVKGKATIHEAGSPRGQRVKDTPESLTKDQFLRTYRNSQARVVLADDSKILITENATLEFKDEQNIHLGEGRVLFDIKKRDAAKSLNVITKTAVIGVKGTQFLVDSHGDDATLHLKEGVIEVTSLDQYKKQQMNDFEQFKKQQMKEFTEYKKSMTIKSGTAVSLSGKGIKEIEFSADELNKLFEELNSF